MYGRRGLGEEGSAPRKAIPAKVTRCDQGTNRSGTALRSGPTILGSVVRR